MYLPTNLDVNHCLTFQDTNDEETPKIVLWLPYTFNWMLVLSPKEINVIKNVNKKCNCCLHGGASHVRSSGVKVHVYGFVERVHACPLLWVYPCMPGLCCGSLRFVSLRSLCTALCFIRWGRVSLASRPCLCCWLFRNPAPVSPHVYLLSTGIAGGSLSWHLCGSGVDVSPELLTLSLIYIIQLWPTILALLLG